ncbi:MAG: sulfurtransferase complex subunit TusC [Halieaceae bacterium]
MSETIKNTTLLIFRQPPYTSSLSRSGLDTALAAGAFEQPVSLLFLSEGLLQLLPQQDSSGLGKRNHGKVLTSLPLYDLETLWVDAESLDELGFGLSDLPEGARLADRKLIEEMLASHDHVVAF